MKTEEISKKDEVFYKYWYPVAQSKEIKQKKPKQFFLFGLPIVLWMNDDLIYSCLEDRCAHRGAPLSAGYIDDQGKIRCRYHGWSYDRNGHCRYVPAEGIDDTTLRARIKSFEVCEQDGLIWIRARSKMFSNSCEIAPPSLAYLKENNFKIFFVHKDFPASLEDIVENIMDSPHASFVHKGFVRGKTELRGRMVQMEKNTDSVSVHHEPVQEKVGFFNVLVNPNNDPVTHSDIFKLPGRLEVRYFFGDKYVFCAHFYCTPRSDNTTTVYMFFALNFGYLTFFAKTIIFLLSKIVLNQDFRILKKLTANKRFFSHHKDVFLESDIGLKYVNQMLKDFRSGAKNEELVTKKFQLYI